MGETLATILAIVLVLMLVCLFGGWALADKVPVLRRFYCRVVVWHCWPSKREYLHHDGCSQHAKCSWCGRKGMLDSQGNLF